MEEYDPDNPQRKAVDPFGDGVKRIAIDDRTPLSETNPKYKKKYQAHKEAGVIFTMCPQCQKMGCHKPDRIDYPKNTVPMGGEICDICGFEETYDLIAHP